MQITSLKKNIMLSTAYEVISIILPFFTAPYVARVLGAYGVGTYSYTNSIQSYFSMFAALGIMSYGKREISRNRDSIVDRSKLFIELQVLLFCTTSIILVLWFIWINITDSFQLYYLILTCSILNVFFDISWYYAGIEKFNYIVYRNLIIKLFLFVLLFIVVRSKEDLYKYILLMVVSSLGGSLSMWLYLKKTIIWVKPNFCRIKSHLKETIVYFIPAVAASIYTILNKILIGSITGLIVENGYYEQATNMINMAKSVTFVSLNSVLGSRIAYLFGQNKIAEVKERINKSIDFILFMGVGLMFGMIGIAAHFVPLFLGDGYEKTIYLLQMLSPIIIIIGISNCLGTHYFTPAGYRSKSSKYLIYGSCVNLLISLFLIPRFLSYGAVLSSLSAETFITILYVKNCGDFLSLKTLLRVVWKKIIAGFFMYLIMFALSNLGVNSFINVFLLFIGGVISYIVMLCLLRDSLPLFFIKDVIRKKK
ncbi:oligosaccharide flippase family protein [Prevotella sp. oral taxon 299]|uniref:oligosaccharide flippase family protein n=1 Tax=Prevotella sp. oral taxon 299 TaxID=652716 RepID=UPI0001C3F98B|nr:oligosaccharide flippase family protein [Prevotella sp. oral taxon 299]EFC71582.1 hypothetical protein HMPREF0669_00254 [Prevotella sp. oral taxon 299 str. F0039]